jgi:aryl-alcohol dehydrogenase-like predicted oxidoreductase
MKRRKLGGTEVGAVGLGCMGMTWAYNGDGSTDEAEHIRVIHRALELGCNLVDTADIYGPFTNEELVGRALRGVRDRAVLATKVGLVRGEEGTFAIRRDGRPEHVRASIDASLRRLGVDWVDLYQLHRVDPNVPLEETWGAMAELVRAGKVRALGFSEAEITVDLLERAQRVHPVTGVQGELSLWTKDVLPEAVPWCERHGVAFLAYSPLGRGFLTGRYQSRDDFAPGDWRLNNPRFGEENMAKNLALVERVKAVAARHQATAGQIALAWTLAQSPCVVPIPGTRKVSRLEENLAAADIALTPGDLAELNDLGEVAGARYLG